MIFVPPGDSTISEKSVESFESQQSNWNNQRVKRFGSQLTSPVLSNETYACERLGGWSSCERGEIRWIICYQIVDLGIVVVMAMLGDLLMRFLGSFPRLMMMQCWVVVVVIAMEFHHTLEIFSLDSINDFLSSGTMDQAEEIFLWKLKRVLDNYRFWLKIIIIYLLYIAA